MQTGLQEGEDVALRPLAQDVGELVDEPDFIVAQTFKNAGELQDFRRRFGRAAAGGEVADIPGLHLGSKANDRLGHERRLGDVEGVAHVFEAFQHLGVKAEAGRFVGGERIFFHSGFNYMQLNS